MTAAVYPLPTPSTVRQLYGSAFRCGHPQCSRPLYKLSDDTGNRVLNSRVAHIHARRKGGPRWLDMPAEENRAFDNLILLCIEHSYEIDEVPDLFPADMLREWKAAQIAEYDSLQRNWPISDDEATEVLVASESFDALHAPSTVELIRRVEALRLVAERTRGVTRSWARRWQQLREQTRRSFSMWDDDGNPVYVEPSEMEVRPMREGIQSALTAALDEVGPAAEATRIELAAVRVTGTQVAPWCDALDRVITELIGTASTWAGGSDPASDTAFDSALEELRRSVTDLVRASRANRSRCRSLHQSSVSPRRWTLSQSTGNFLMKPGRSIESVTVRTTPNSAGVLQRQPVGPQRFHRPRTSSRSAWTPRPLSRLRWQATRLRMIGSTLWNGIDSGFQSVPRSHCSRRPRAVATSRMLLPLLRVRACAACGRKRTGRARPRGSATTSTVSR